MTLANPASLDVCHAYDHRPARIKGQILKSPPSRESAYLIVDRMCDHAEASDVSRGSECRAEGEQKKRAGVTLSVVILVDRKLTE